MTPRKAYVIGASIPRGGTYMAYHIGRILHQHFGYALVDVQVSDVTQPRVFDYDIIMETMSIAEMEKQASARDVLIVNPSFSDAMFGLRLPCKKIMYVQDFRTFQSLDCFCDLYVSVSSVVQNFLRTTYQMDTQIIPPFIDVSAYQAPAWDKRPEGSCLVYMKQRDRVHETLRQWCVQAFQHAGISLSLERIATSHQLSHAAFLQALGSVRYVLNLCVAEGFGLIPLEAMALGTLVLGTDGLAGRDYMRLGENCYTVSAPRLRTDFVHMVAGLRAPVLPVLERAQHTAAEYSLNAFTQRWIATLAPVVT